MPTLLENLNQIKEEKDTKILPENIKKDVRIFDVVGTLESGEGDVKLFTTVEEMQADPDPHEGDKAVVYGNIPIPVQETTVFSSFIAPDTVVLSEPVVSYMFTLFADTNGLVKIELNLDTTVCAMDIATQSGNFSIYYSSDDGETYTKTQGERIIQLGADVRFVYCGWSFSPVIGEFIKVMVPVFNGLYQYDATESGSYVFVPTQLTLNSANQLLPGLIALGANGAVTGDGSIAIPDNSFADTAASLYSSIQNRYEVMQPRVLTDYDRTIDTGIFVIPTKSDGTPLLDTSNVTNMNSMFSGCNNLTTIPLLDTSNVTYTSSMFNGCSNLTTIPLLDTSNVTDVSYMFSGCSNLASVPELDTSNVTNMNYMFYSCQSLTSIPELDTSNVTDMNGVFNACSDLTDESLNNILQMCINAVKITENKTLQYVGLSEYQATQCTTLSNYAAFTDAGWTTGY